MNTSANAKQIDNNDRCDYRNDPAEADNQVICLESGRALSE